MNDALTTRAQAQAAPPPDARARLTAARLAARLERAGVELVVVRAENAGSHPHPHPHSLTAIAPDPATLARVITPAVREEITRAKPALLVVLDPALDSLPALSPAFSALVREDPAWSPIPACARVSPSEGTRCVYCDKPAEHRFGSPVRAVHPSCFFARVSPHVLALPAGVSTCWCPACDGTLVLASALDPLDALFGATESEPTGPTYGFPATALGGAA